MLALKEIGTEIKELKNKSEIEPEGIHKNKLEPLEQVKEKLEKTKSNLKKFKGTEHEDELEKVISETEKYLCEAFVEIFKELADKINNLLDDENNPITYERIDDLVDIFDKAIDIIENNKEAKNIIEGNSNDETKIIRVVCERLTKLSKLGNKEELAKAVREKLSADSIIPDDLIEEIYTASSKIINSLGIKDRDIFRREQFTNFTLGILKLCTSKETLSFIAYPTTEGEDNIFFKPPLTSLLKLSIEENKKGEGHQLTTKYIEAFLLAKEKYANNGSIEPKDFDSIKDKDKYLELIINYICTLTEEQTEEEIPERENAILGCILYCAENFEEIKKENETKKNN